MDSTDEEMDLDMETSIDDDLDVNNELNNAIILNEMEISDIENKSETNQKYSYKFGNAKLQDEEISSINEELCKAINDNINKIEIPYVENESESDLMKQYPHDMLMYNNSLIGQMSLDELEKLGLERLEVLRIIDVLMKESSIKSEDFKECLLGALRNKGFYSYVKLITSPGCDSNTTLDLETRRKDHISHFILKIALCKKLKIFRWFINMERQLFCLRFNSLNKNGFEKFLIFNNINYPILSDEEKNENRENLQLLHEDINLEETIFYKVPYLSVRNLIKYRKAFIKGGIVFLPCREIYHLISQSFQESLLKEREHLKTVIEKNPRLGPILKKFFIASNNSLPHEINSLDLQTLDETVQQSYPLCMRIMHEALRKDHFLKNDGRFQYGLFLKLIGLSYDGAVDFWSGEFCKKINPTQFDQKYLYDVKYVYGKVGQKANYTSYSCNSVMSRTVGYGLYHGCPYKNMTVEILNSKLETLGVSNQGLVEIEDLVREEKYKEACTKCFSQIHGINLPSVVDSPAEYFHNSKNAILRKKHIQIKINESLVNETQENNDNLNINSDKSTTK